MEYKTNTHKPNTTIIISPKRVQQQNKKKIQTDKMLNYYAFVN